MQRLVNLLRGTVTVRVTGRFPERYFNICAADGLGLWGCRTVSEGELEVTLARRDLARAIALGERALCQVEVLRRDGAPALARKLRRRYGMAAGALLLLGMLLFLSQFVLVIQVEGNTTVSDSQILAQLQSNGFGVGSYGPDVDVRAIANRVLMEMEELSFLSINISGIRAQVVVRENDPAPEILDRTRAADIVAKRDGVVMSVDVLGGRAVAEQGQAVLAGEVLISGMLLVEQGDGSGTVVASEQIMARGEVWAMTSRTLQAVTPLAVLTPGEEGSSGWALSLLGRSLNFYGNSSNQDMGCDKMVILYPITLPGGQQLPFRLRQVVWQSWTETGADPDSCQRFLRRSLSQRLEEILDGGQVLSTRWQTEETEEAVTVTLTAQCLEQIGQTVYLE